jgi:multisubunit Na+/H+ antiporter MnhB subunit
MKRTTDEIEGPVRKSTGLLVAGIVVLAGLLALGVFLIAEALKEPEGPQDVLDTKRMIVSGVGVVLFSIAVLFFLVRTFRTTSSVRGGRKRTTTTGRRASASRKPARKKAVSRK